MTRFMKRGGKIWIRLFPGQAGHQEARRNPYGQRQGRARSLGGGGAAGTRFCSRWKASRRRMRRRPCGWRRTSCLADPVCHAGVCGAVGSRGHGESSGLRAGEEPRAGIMEAEQDSQYDRRRAEAAGAGAERSAVPAEVPAQHGADGEPEEDSRAAQRHRAGEDHCPRARAGRRRKRRGQG